MATRFPPTFSIGQGLLSTQEMTPEEEERLLQEQLYGLQVEDYADPEDDASLEEYIPAEGEEFADEEAPYPEQVNDSSRPLVIDAEPVATNGRNPTPLNPDGTDPLAALPEVAQPAPRKAQAEQEPSKPPKGKPLVKDVEEERPEVIDAAPRTYEPLLQQARQAKANVDAAGQGRNVSKTKAQAAYDQMVAKGIYEMAQDPNVTAEDLTDWAFDLSYEVFGGDVANTWTRDSAEQYLNYAKGRIAAGEPVLPPSIRIEGAKEVSVDPEKGWQQTLEEGFGKGALQTVGSAAAGIQAIQEATGLSEPEATDRWRRWASAVAGEFPEGPRLENVDSFADAVRWAGNVAMENTANLASSAAGGIVGGVVRGSVGAALGAFGTSFVQEAGQIEQGNKALNPEQKAGLATMVSAGGAALLDSILPTKLGSQLTNRFGKEVADDIAMKMLLMPGNAGRIARIKAIAKGGLSGAGLEAITEGAQTGIEMLGTAVETGTDLPEDALWQMFEGAAAGAVLGGPAGAVGTAGETGAKIEAAKLKPQLTDNAGQKQDFAIPSGKVTSAFGPRQTFRTANGKMASSNHAGIDIALPSGAPAPVGADGEVIFAGKNGGYGNQVVVRHSDGTTSSYSHLSKINVEEGDQVTQGQAIGKVGKTGNATGPHLHLERRDAQGRAVNPQTAGPVVTTRDEEGNWTDNTNWEAGQKEIDNFYDDMLAGQQTEQPDVPTTPEEMAIARGEETDVVAPEPAPARGDVEGAIAAVVAGPSSAQTMAIQRGSELDAKKGSSPAHQALASLQSLQTPAREQQDLSQPMIGEEPVFSDNTGTEVVGFTNPETGTFRAVGEDVTVAEAQPVQQAPAQAEPTPTIPEEGALPVEAAPVEQAPVEEAPPPQVMAATTEQLEAERQQRLMDAMPPIPESASREVAEARYRGRAAALGIEEAPPLSGMNKAQKTAFNIGLKEGQKALATSGTPGSVGKSSKRTIPTAPKVQAPVPRAKAPAKVPAPDKVAQQKAEMAAREEAALANLPKTKVPLPANPVARKKAIEKHVDRIENKLFDLENDGTKGQVKTFMQKLVREGFIEQADIDSVSYMFKDRDMGVDDVTSEVKQMIRDWEEAHQPAKQPVKKQQAVKKEEANETRQGTDSGRPEDGGRRGQQDNAGTGELERPPVNKDGTVTLQHYSKVEGLTETDPSLWGQFKNIFTREERAYMEKAPPRTYFGIATGRPGGYKIEFLGRHEHEARIPLERLYDAGADPDNLWVNNPDVRGKPWIGERNIKNAGYAGYWFKHQELGMVGVVFEKVPVTATGRAPKKQVSVRPQVAVSGKIPDMIGSKTWQDVFRVLQQMGLDGHPDLTVDIIDKFLDDKPGQTTFGEYDPNIRRIRIAAMAGHSATLTARHELIHWMRDAGVISKEDWLKLADWAKNHTALRRWAEKNYKTHGLTEDALIEEMVAEAFSRWQGGNLQDISTSDSKIVQFFEKMQRVFQAIRDAFTGAGVTREQINAATEIFDAIERGKQIEKFNAAKRPVTVTFGKRRTPWSAALSRDMLAGRISPEERAFMAENPRDTKDQSAWHGSPRTDIEEFSTKYIGTGEGAQAFGWGLYFAQRQEVAEWYRKKLVLGGKRDPVDVIVQKNGVPFRDLFPNTSYDAGAVYEVADRIMNFLATNKPYNGWLETIHAEFDNDIETWVKLAEADAKDPELAAEMANEISLLRESQKNVEDVFRVLKVKDGGVASTIKVADVDGGKLYKVEVPDNDELIFLDKTVAQQSEGVRLKLDEVRKVLDQNGELENFEDRFGVFEDWTGLELTRVVMPNMIYSGIEPKNPSSELDTALTNGQSQMATSIWLRDLGIPGARYLDQDSRGQNQGQTTNFVIFDDGAVKLATKKRVIHTPVNSPLSDPTQPNPGIFRRIHDQTMGLIGALAGKDVDAADNIVDAFKRKVTQRYRQIEKTQERAAALQGVNRLPAGQNVMEMITADERGYKLQFLTDNMVKPMATEMARRGVSMDDLGLFLYARHAPARNARIAKINPEFRNPANPGSGMTDAEAMQIMADFQNDGKLSDLAAVATNIDAMIAFAQAERLAGGLISQADMAAGFGPSDFYVPLRGNEGVEPELEMDFALAARKGGGFSTSGKESHRMFGRSSKADLEEIVGYTITQAQDAVDRAYRNRVAQTMLEMFRTTPDPDFVKIDRVKRVAVWNKAKGQVEYQMQTRITDPKEQQRIIYVKENGDVTKMTFSDKNPSAMRFVAAAKNLGIQELPRYLQLMSAFTRVWSKSNTQWNPDFILANATKDVQTGVLNAKTLDQKGLRRKMLKNLASLGPLRGALYGSLHGAGAGFNSSNQWHQVFAEFEANGGKLNYGQIEPLEDAIRSAKREMRNAKRSPINPIKAVATVGNFIDHINSAFENMTRLAAYKALRDLGIPAKQAAEGVRELTTNFQQHGEWGPKFNAAYGFANASVIGGSRFLKTAVKSPAIPAGLIALGMMSDLLNSMSDDDWDRYSEEDKHGNLIFMMPDEFGFDIKIPAGYGLNAFITAGRKMSELWRGKKKADGTTMSLLDAASDVGMGFINAFSPITGQSFWNIVTPTIGDPVVNIYRNENNWGRPIMPPEAFRKEQQKPHSQLAFDNTSQFWKSLATTMNAIGGGNEVIAGWTPLDISPETYKHVTGETLGGAGRTFMRTVGLIEKAATGQDVGLNDVPIVRRFAGNPYGAATAKGEQVSEFYTRMGEARETIAQAKEMMARYGKESEEYQAFRKDNQPIIEFATTVEEAEKRLKAYNTAENAAERGANRIDGLKRRDRKAIFKVTKYVVPSGRALKPEEVAKIKAKIKEKKERLALLFNDKYNADVMKAE